MPMSEITTLSDLFSSCIWIDPPHLAPYILPDVIPYTENPPMIEETYPILLRGDPPYKSGYTGPWITLNKTRADKAYQTPEELATLAFHLHLGRDPYKYVLKQCRKLYGLTPEFEWCLKYFCMSGKWPEVSHERFRYAYKALVVPLREMIEMIYNYEDTEKVPRLVEAFLSSSEKSTKKSVIRMMNQHQDAFGQRLLPAIVRYVQLPDTVRPEVKLFILRNILRGQRGGVPPIE